jgi:signal transduction histidine kinase
MPIASLLAVGITRRDFPRHLQRMGYQLTRVGTIEEIERVDAPYDILLIDQKQLARQSAAITERLHFLSNNAPVAICADDCHKIDKHLVKEIQEGGLEMLYYGEIAIGLFFARLDKLLVLGQFDRNLLALQDNIRERQRLQKELSIRNQIVDHERELNAHIIESITSGLIIIDLSGIILRINEFGGRVLKISVPDCTGLAYKSVMPPEISALIDRFLLKDPGSRRPAGPTKVKLDESFLQISGYGMFDERKNVRGLILFVQDISEQESVAMQLYRAEKLATIGTMLSGIAHELRNPLSIISARTQRALARSEPDHDYMIKTFDSIEKQTKRCSSIVNNLLDFTRHHATAFGYHSIADILDETLTYVEYQNVFDSIRVVKEYGADLMVFGDRSRYVQAFLNIISNAADAMSGRGTLTLKTSATGQKFVLVQIVDTGSGISPEIQSRIFDPFFTTKDPGIGTGLGLAIVQKIIQESGGRISVQSSPGATIFSIKLPSSAKDLKHA